MKKPIPSALEYFANDADAPSRSRVRREYLAYRARNGMPERCDVERCSLHAGPLLWNGKKAKLILDHVDGCRRNSRAENLRLLCGNCNLQQPTTGGANKGRIKDVTDDAYTVMDKGEPEHRKVMLTGISMTASANTLKPS